MTKTKRMWLAFLGVGILFTGCNANLPPAEGEETAQLTSAVSAPAQSLSSESSEMVPAEEEQLRPIYGSQIQDGTYPIAVTSSSSMFRITDAQLTVDDGKMSAVLTLSGTGYEKLYMGTGDEALADTDDKCIYFVENADGKYTYEVPVDALDQEIDCAAWSIKKKKWYDRTLVFQSALLPADAINRGQTIAAELPSDGQYEIAVTLTGGTGRAAVQSPAKLTIINGAATAVIIWNSPYYEYMLVDGMTYHPVNTDGNSTFEIPVLLDKEMAISAQTIAMSEPHIIDYTLRFDSAAIRPLEKK